MLNIIHVINVFKLICIKLFASLYIAKQLSIYQSTLILAVCKLYLSSAVILRGLALHLIFCKLSVLTEQALFRSRHSLLFSTRKQISHLLNKFIKTMRKQFIFINYYMNPTYFVIRNIFTCTVIRLFQFISVKHTLYIIHRDGSLPLFKIVF